LSSGEAVVYFIIAVLLDVVVGLRAQPGVLQGYLFDPDTLMRLVRLRDILAQHAPLHVVARDGSGDGTILHWSHLLDSLLLLLGLPLRLWLSWDDALHVVAVAFGPINVGLLGVATAWATAPLTERCWRCMAPVLVALAPPIIGYGQPGVADHHILLALAAVMMAGAAGRLAMGDVAAGLTLGTWCAASLWLLPEAMPFIVMAFGGVGLAWLMAPRMRTVGTGIASAGASFLLLTYLELAVDPPAGGSRSTTIDALSITYLLLAAFVCGSAWSLFMIDRLRLSRVWRGLLGSGAATAGLLLWLGLFPVMLHGPEALDYTPEAQTMFSSIQEFVPVRLVVPAVTLLSTGACAAALLVWLALRDRYVAWKSALWAYSALCVIGLEALGQSHVRFATYPNAAAATMLPVALTELTRMLSSRSEGWRATARIALLSITFLAMRADTVAALCGWFDRETPPQPAACNLQRMSPALALLAGEIVLTDVNDVPRLLYSTRIRTVGSMYHASIGGFSRLRAAWRSGPSRVEPDEVRATKATFVLFCRQAGRSGLVADLPGQTLWDRLGRGEVPAWLHVVASDAQSGVVLYSIVDLVPDGPQPVRRS
jgi:hypothetical protein